ncbi:S-adenosyl-L-methionine-dependent methyltransferase [Piromyces finnis]|uniref:Trimethylguanosine synthase n=1 Tax=Piromyces finnis TaxID=1754191 RepID=A0A1Y1V6F5_9FUNG|nr:S-adenosyl-L-methionine-dependent methyltransferase [Piromyces finnis]|eukprot:ORX48400.1 S-adenosyl-L-methionine-dependent methyltransferase [Piromyces finnis]
MNDRKKPKINENNKTKSNNVDVDIDIDNNNKTETENENSLNNKNTNNNENNENNHIKGKLLEENTAINNIAEKISIFNQLINKRNSPSLSPLPTNQESGLSKNQESIDDKIFGTKILKWSYETLPEHIKKYWHQRYSLFSKFDDGIMLDEESWFSVTHEKIAQHIAKRCKCNVIVDGFCGAGGNSIQFAKYCEKVISIDIDPVKIECARNNAKIYGVEDKIEFINGNFLELIPSLKEKYSPDVIFISPPWGGPSYLKMDYYDLCYVQPIDGVELFNMVKSVTNNIAYYLPRNCDYDQIRLLADPGQVCELEQEYLNDKMRSFTIYFGNLVNTVNPILLEDYEKEYEMNEIEEDDDEIEEKEEAINTYLSYE